PEHEWLEPHGVRALRASGAATALLLGRGSGSRRGGCRRGLVLLRARWGLRPLTVGLLRGLTLGRIGGALLGGPLLASLLLERGAVGGTLLGFAQLAATRSLARRGALRVRASARCASPLRGATATGCGGALIAPGCLVVVGVVEVAIV